MRLERQDIDCPYYNNSKEFEIISIKPNDTYTQFGRDRRFPSLGSGMEGTVFSAIILAFLLIQNTTSVQNHGLAHMFLGIFRAESQVHMTDSFLYLPPGVLWLLGHCSW